MNKVNRFIITLLASVIMASCGDVVPATWDDVATGVPADGEIYVVLPDSVIGSDIFKVSVGEESLEALDVAMGLCSSRPKHIVGFDCKSKFVFTWPVSNPDELAEAVKDWREKKMFGDMDGRIKIVGGYSIVVSETQVWVVNTRDGVSVVNEALESSAGRSASSVPVLRNLVVGTDATTNVLYRLGDDDEKNDVRYVLVYTSFVPTGLNVNLEIRNSDGTIKPFADLSESLDVPRLRSALDGRAFAAYCMPVGFVSKAVKAVGGLLDDAKMRIAVAAVAPIFERAGGTIVVAVGRDGMVEVKLPFVSADDAGKAYADLGAIMRRVGAKVDMTLEDDAIVFRHDVDLQSLGVEIMPKTESAEVVAEPLIGLAEGRVTNGEYTVDFDARMTAQRVRMNILLPTPEAFRDVINGLSER